MLKRSEGYFRGKNDFELFFQCWTPEKPTGTLVITHGLGEHTECYQRLVDGVRELNLECIAWDLRGHGRSEGKRGVIKEFSDYSADLSIFIEFIKKEISDRKIALLGHSMGGLVNLNTLAEYKNLAVDCAIFSSPLLGVQLEVPAFKKAGAKYIAQYLPSFTMWNEIPDANLTHDKKILEEFTKDSFRHDRISPQLFLEMQVYIEKIKKAGDKITLPVLFQISGQDKVVSARATIDFFDTVKSQNKKLKIYENSFHEIYNEIEREIVFKDLSEWLSENFLGK